MVKLTERDLEVLSDLEAANRQLKPFGSEWATPLHCGGSNGSDHSYRLSKLARLGFAQSKQRGGADPEDGTNGKRILASRGSKCYRITDAGRAALAEQQP